MGECLIVRRGGESYELPVLSASYPKDVTVTAAAGASASFSVSITTPGRPAEYTYQWYRNGAAVSGGTAASLTLTGLTAATTYSVYCKVTNKAGSVNSRTATLTVRSYLPTYTYTGSHQLIDEGNFNWRLRLLTSGTLTFSYVGSAGDAGRAGVSGGRRRRRGATSVRAEAAVIPRPPRFPHSPSARDIPSLWARVARPATVRATTVPRAATARPSERWRAAARAAGPTSPRAGMAARVEAAVPLAPAARTAATAALEPAATPRGPGGNGQGSTTREFGSPAGTLYSSGGGGMDEKHTYDQQANTRQRRKRAPL